MFYSRNFGNRAFGNKTELPASVFDHVTKCCLGSPIPRSTRLKTSEHKHGTQFINTVFSTSDSKNADVLLLSKVRDLNIFTRKSASMYGIGLNVRNRPQCTAV